MRTLDLTTAHIYCLRIIPLGRLNGYVPEEELNLLQFAAGRMAQPGTGPSEIVRRETLNARFTGVLANDMPDCLFG